jgi:hypothetical protein
MDVLRRCNLQIDNIRRARVHLARLRERVEGRPHSPRVAELYSEVVALDRVLTDRTRQVVAAMGRLDATGQGADEVELDVELIGHLERKLLTKSALLAREFNARSAKRVLCDEEPLG